MEWQNSISEVAAKKEIDVIVQEYIEMKKKNRRRPRKIAFSLLKSHKMSDILSSESC